MWLSGTAFTVGYSSVDILETHPGWKSAVINHVIMYICVTEKPFLPTIRYEMVPTIVVAVQQTTSVKNELDNRATVSPRMLRGAFSKVTTVEGR